MIHPKIVVVGMSVLAIFEEKPPKPPSLLLLSRSFAFSLLSVTWCFGGPVLAFITFLALSYQPAWRVSEFCCGFLVSSKRF